MAILSNVMEQGQILGKNSAEMGKSIVLAGMGVFSFVEEKSKGFLESLIGQGEKFKKDELSSITEKVNSLKNNVKTQIRAKESDMETRLQNAFTGILHRLGVPTKTEVRDLIAHVEELTRKVEELKKGKVTS